MNCSAKQSDPPVPPSKAMKKPLLPALLAAVIATVLPCHEDAFSADTKPLTTADFTISDPLMIEDCGFHEDGKSVVVKSHGIHGPATTYRATIATGEVSPSYNAFDPALPAWSKPFSDGNDAAAAPVAAGDEKPYTPKIGSPVRKAILDSLRVEVAAEQKREDPNGKYKPSVFTPSHFKVLGNWAFVDTAMEPAYGEQGGVIAALQLVGDKWQVKFTSYADDVTNYDKLAKKLAAPRSIFPAQGKIE